MAYTRPISPSPAPWRFKPFISAFDGRIISGEVFDANNELVCDDKAYYAHHVEIADMVLIAAAPEMLKILEKCLKDELNRRKKLLNKSTAACYADARVEKMKAVIAKAKGVE